MRWLRSFYVNGDNRICGEVVVRPGGIFEAAIAADDSFTLGLYISEAGARAAIEKWWATRNTPLRLKEGF